MNTLKALIKAECARITELLNDKETFDNTCTNSKKSELKAKMAELRRDTIRLEKKLYYMGAE
jgi:hypothetical protein